MSYGQGGPQQPQWDPWKPNSQQPWNSGDDGQTPDWAALAEASEARNRRRRMLFIGGGALATLAVGAAVALAVTSADDPVTGGDPSPLPPTASIPGESATAPSFAPTSAPPPLNPKDFVSDKKKDTAPLGPDILFPGSQLTVGSTVYKKGPTADTTTCAAAARGTLPKALTAGGCTRLMRVTYTQGGIAVTVGVAVFDTEAQALKARRASSPKTGMVQPLSGKGVKPFCDGAVCRSTTNSYGRYAYFTLTGFTSGKNVTTKDTKAFSSGNDLALFAFNQIKRRGEAQASAAVANG
ncbi:hypothetical protein C3489_10345 [Streptomyces sp. Ru71]|uniref:hypothetical protein n=1 Tax=Streptomyces sp. Ru71 TaxID=2080746 RepID=UPI000CDD1078|nr:hypothetical protein [Streptomyces sp. Ru71]POX55441.1 hypothetical protein C3489_10345 [Streptomyces sp. Ru71]